MFGLDLGNLLVHIRGDDVHLNTVLRRAGMRVNRFASDVDRAVGAACKVMIAASTVAAGASIKAFASFDDAMTRSTAIMSGVTKQMDERMRKLAITMSRKGVQSATQLAESYFYLASAGLNVEQSIAALPAVQQFATAGAFDMALATDLLTDAQSALGLTVEDTEQNLSNMVRISDVLVGANTVANASTQQFSEGLMRAGPAMKAYGIGLEEGVAVLAAYADQGKKSAEGGEMFSRMLRMMIAGFNDNKEAWDRHNISIVDANDNLRPLAEVVKDLTTFLGGMGVTQKAAALEMLGFTALSQKALMPLLGMGSAIELNNEKLLEMGGITKDVAEKQLTSFGVALRIAWNNIKAVGIMLGSIISEGMPAFQNFFTKLTDWMLANEHNFRAWGHAVVSTIKSIVDYLLDVQKGLEQILPSGVSKIAEKQAEFEYKLRMGQQGLKPYTTTTRQSTAAMMGGGAGAGMGGRMVTTTTRTNEVFYQQILDKVVKDTQRTFDETQREWDLGYENAVNTANAAYKEIKGAQTKALALPEEFPEATTASLEEIAEALQKNEDHVQAYRTLLGEMGRMSKDVYTKQMEHLRKIAEQYEDVGVGITTINLWLKEQQELLKIDYLKQGGLIDGLIAYRMEVERTMKTAGEKAFEFAQSMEQSIANGLQAMSRDLDNWAEHAMNILREVYFEALRIALIQPVSETAAGAFAQIGSAIFGALAGGGGDGGQQAGTGSGYSGGRGGYAEGGIAWRPQVANLAEDEPELIVPFSKLGSMGGTLIVNVINETGQPMQVTKQEQYMISDQRIVDVSVAAAGTNGTYRRSHGITS